MSWDSLESREFLNGRASHQLSATRLLSSPDGSKHGRMDDNSVSKTTSFLLLSSSLNSSPRPVSKTSLLFSTTSLASSPHIDHCPFPEDSFSHIGNHGSSRELRNGALRLGARMVTSRASSLFDCFRPCAISIQHYFAKRKMYRGVALYSRNKHQAAMNLWLAALKKIRQRTDKFQLLGYLYQAFMDQGRYRESLEFAQKQLYVSEELDSAPMRAEAYLNLARANQTLGVLDRAMSYARYALYNECGAGSLAGHVHLTVALVNLEYGVFGKSMESFQKALNVAQTINDTTLMLQVYVGLSEVWVRLRDIERAVSCATRACDLARGPRSTDLNTRHHRRALLQMSHALRHRGELGPATDYCNEALKLSAVAGDQGCYARAVRIAGDIYRKKCDIAKALRHYEVAMGQGQALGDRLAQMEGMDGAARCLEILRLQGKICNCRPLEFNTRLLEVVTSVGSKMLTRTVRLRLAEIYTALGDSAAASRASKAAPPPPTCALCSEELADEDNRLATLPCAHVVHADCLPSPSKRGSTVKPETPGCRACAAAASAPPPLPPPPPHPNLLQAIAQDFPFESLPRSFRESDLNSILSDSSSHQITSSV